MTVQEFIVLNAVVALSERDHRVLSVGVTVAEIRDFLFDNGWPEWEPPQITGSLVSMRRRRLVVAKPAPRPIGNHLRLVHGERARSKRWLPTLYGSNVASA